MGNLTKRMLVGAVSLAALAGVGQAGAQEQQKPQYGGALEVGSEFVTLSPISFDPADWGWKLSHDTSFYAETLMVGDLNKSVSAGGKYNFVADAWLPSDAIKGELAESWEVSGDPPKVTFRLRQGIMWPEKPGVMKSRELVADDFVFSFNYLAKSPKAIPTYYDYIDKVEALDKYTVVFHFNRYNAEWDYRYGWGYYSTTIPKELAEAGAANWRNATGTGPFVLADYVQGNSQTYKKRPDYWGKATIGGQEYQLPFVDQVTYRIIRDEASQHAALRTGKLDMLQTISWRAVDNLKKSAPELKWNRNLLTRGTYVALRMDTKPFDDIRVRRALNMAVNKQEIIDAYYGGNAEMLNYPMYKDWEGYYEPLESMPDSVKELFTYDPAKAKKLLAEAGYPNGFSFKVQVCSCSPDHMDLLPLIAGYLEQVGVRMEIQPLEYGAFLNTMVSKQNAPGYLMDNGHTNPTTSLRKNFYTKQTWNAAQYSDPALDKRIDAMLQMRNEDDRKREIRAMTIEILDKAPYIWLPSQYRYSAWWPWVKNYSGELNVGAYRTAPIFARVWIDQELKKKMGH